MKVLVTDFGFPDVEEERRIIRAAGHELVVGQCKTPRQVMELAADADALLVQWAPINAAVIARLEAVGRRRHQHRPERQPAP